MALTIPFALAAMVIESQGIFLVSVFMTSILATACYPVCSAILVDVLNPKESGVGMSFLLIEQNGIGLTLASLLVGAISDITGSLLQGLMLAPVLITVAMVFSMILKRLYLADFKALAVI